MQIVEYPSKDKWEVLLKRPVADASELSKTVRKIMQQVKKNGDSSVRKFTHQFDGIRLRKFEVSQKEIKEASKYLDDELKNRLKDFDEQLLLH